MIGAQAATPPKACAGCTRCCELMPVRELNVAGFAGCPHVAGPPARTPGCAIYSDRPISCQLWNCMWKTGLDWPAELRPDRCGFVFDEVTDLVKINGKEMVCAQVWVAPGRADEWSREPVSRVVQALVAKGLVVLFRTAPKTAFAVLRDAKGRLICTASHQPEWTESDETRLKRAALLLEGMPERPSRRLQKEIAQARRRERSR